MITKPQGITPILRHMQLVCLITHLIACTALVEAIPGLTSDRSKVQMVSRTQFMPRTGITANCLSAARQQIFVPSRRPVMQGPRLLLRGQHNQRVEFALPVAGAYNANHHVGYGAFSLGLRRIRSKEDPSLQDSFADCAAGTQFVPPHCRDTNEGKFHRPLIMLGKSAYCEV